MGTESNRWNNIAVPNMKDKLRSHLAVTGLENQSPPYASSELNVQMNSIHPLAVYNRLDCSVWV